MHQIVSVIRRNFPVNFDLKNISLNDWGIILVLVTAIYFYVNVDLPDLFTSFSRTYVIRPMLWSMIAVCVILISRHGTPGRLVFTKSFLLIGILMGACHVACLVITGLLMGFGHSPYSHTPYMVFLHLVYFGAPLVALEFSRAYLLNSFGNRYLVIKIGIIALFFTAIMTPWAQLTDMYGDLPYVGGTMLPLLAQNLVACLLAILGGPIAAIAYMSALAAFEWFSPILPNTEWIILAFMGTMVPVILIMMLQSLQFKPEAEEVEGNIRKRSSLVGWVTISIVALILVWFSFGVVGIRPVVVVSGSMNPAIDVGDIAVVRDVSADDISVGDIIQYETGSITLIHRVIEIQHEGSLTFITQGDDNDIPDADPVSPEQIEGRVFFTVPKLGWVSIKLKEFLY